MASRQLMIPRIEAAGTSFSPLPYQAWHGYGVTSAHRVEVEVRADGPASAPLSGAATAAPPAGAASLQFGATRAFTLTDGTSLETQIEERRPWCLMMSSAKIQKIMRKTRRSIGRNAEFYVINYSPATEQPAEFHNGEELIAQQRGNFRPLLYNDFLELLHLVNSPHVNRQRDHPIETTAPMKPQRLNRLSHEKHAELNRQLKDAMKHGIIRPSHSEFGLPILFVR
jgi:hypothetical protein